MLTWVPIHPFGSQHVSNDVSLVESFNGRGVRRPPPTTTLYSLSSFQSHPENWAPHALDTTHGGSLALLI
jgi:hypothetical protein